MRLLFAEDEPTIRASVARGLTDAGYAVDAVADGDEAILAIASVDYDALILDITMPGTSGLDVCRKVRASKVPGPPILFLTARDSVDDRVSGLDAGAEDYLVKPFALPELLARVRALLRRMSTSTPLLKVHDLVLDPATRTTTRNGQPVSLSPKEFALLEYLVRNAGRVVTRAMISEHVWNFDLEGESNFIEVFIYSLRRKVDVPFESGLLIQTVRGVGYRLNVAAD